MLFIGFFTSVVPYIILSIVYLLWLGVSVFSYVEQTQTQPLTSNKVIEVSATNPSVIQVFSTTAYYFSTPNVSETEKHIIHFGIPKRHKITTTQKQLTEFSLAFSMFSRPPPTA